MSNVIQLPVIAGVEITTDEEGRFNLNALHRASGGKKNKQPSNWLRLDTTQELIGELTQELSGSSDMRNDTEIPVSLVNVVQGGRRQGTFVHEELAIEYAGWISARFRIKVNRTFRDYKSGKLNPINPDQISRKSLAQMVIESEERAEVLMLENKAKDERIEKLESFFHPGMTITAFGKMLNGVNCSQMNNFCYGELNWLYNESRSGKNRRFRVRSSARDRYLTETDRPIGTHGGETFIKHEPKLLINGAKKLYSLYLDGKLPMKKTWDGEFTHMKFAGAAA